MNPILILAGLAALWIIVNKRQSVNPLSSQSLTTSGSRSSGISIGSGIPPISTNTTDAQITSGIGTALKHDPDPTGISQSVLGVADQISGLFTQAHQAALAKEANTLNNATPTFITQVEQVVTALNQGGITETEAISYLQQAQSIYYETVSTIIRGRWVYAGSQFPEPTWSDSYQNRSGPFGSKNPNPDSHAPDPCNAACVVGHYFIERTVVGLTRIIKAGGGTITIEASPQNGQIRGTPSVTITYVRYSTAANTSLQHFLGL